MYKNIVYVFVIVLLTGASGETAVNPLDGFNITSKLFQMPESDTVRSDVAQLSQIPPNGKIVEHCRLYETAEKRMNRLLLPEFVPPISFIQSNVVFCTVPKFPKQDTGRMRLYNGYDAVYLPYRLEGMDILFVMTYDSDYGADYFFIRKNGQKSQFSDMQSKDILRNLMQPDAYKILAPGVKEITFEERVSFYEQKSVFCITRLNRFKIFLGSTPISFGEWFNREKKIEEQERMEGVHRIAVAEKCRQLSDGANIKTIAGRVKLIGLLSSGKVKAAFDERRDYEEYVQSIYKSLLDYYLCYSQTEETILDRVWQSERFSLAEADALRTLLASPDEQAHESALWFIDSGSGRSLVPDMLKQYDSKIPLSGKHRSQAHKSYTSVIIMPDGEQQLVTHLGQPVNTYHYLVFSLIGHLGGNNARTALTRLLQQDDLSPEQREDILRAKDEIKSNLERHAAITKRIQDDIRKDRQLAREGKIIYDKNDLKYADIDMPDIPSDAPKDVRYWKTVEGLFKVTARFIALKDGEVILELLDGKRTTIALEDLRKEDQEYIRRQIELDQKKLKD